MNLKAKIRQLGQQLASDRKKLAFVLALVALCAFLLGRPLLKQPKPARVDAAARTGLTPSPKSQSGPTHTAIPRTVYVDLPQSLSRNLFALHPDFYPELDSEDTTSHGEEKSIDDSADKSEVAHRLRQDLEELALQTTILSGDEPKAMINRRVLAPGEVIQGFELMAVFPRHVVLRRDGIMVLLKM